MTLGVFLSKLYSVHTVEIWNYLDLDADLDVVNGETYNGPCSIGMLFSFCNPGQIDVKDVLKKEWLELCVEIVFFKKDSTVCVGVKEDITNE